ncbi:MAG: NFACT RNA binding domain-containing protein, partial [Planctomycetota bacterium]|nr:NFACT RNA binding domain-containing protein [Planctomycetota bacterium]
LDGGAERRLLAELVGRPGGGGPSLREAFDLPAEADSSAAAPLSRRVEEVLGRAAEERLASAARRDLVARVQRRIKSTKGRRRGLAERRRAADQAERVRMDGELLKAHQGELRRGLSSVELSDWFVEGSPPRRIELEPKLRPQENVVRFFARYKKLLRDRETLDAEEARTAEVLAELESLLAAARDEARDPVALESEALERRLLKPRQEPDKRKRAAPAPRLSYRRFQGSKGSEIRVGRSAADNDRLTLRESRGNDVWLHTRDAPGSHVVLRIERGREPDPDEVLDAAHLALHFSPLRGARKAAIHVARCKEVRKFKGAPPGLVQLSGGKTLQLRVEPERLARLLDTRPDPGRGAVEAR